MHLYKSWLLKSRNLKLTELNYAGKVKGPKGYQTRSEVKKDRSEIVEQKFANIGDEIVEEEEQRTLDKDESKNNREKNNEIEFDKNKHKICIKISRSFEADNLEEPHNLEL